MIVRTPQKYGLIDCGDHCKLLVGNFRQKRLSEVNGIELQLQSCDSRNKIVDSMNIWMSREEGMDLACRLLARSLGSELRNDSVTFLEKQLCAEARIIIARELGRLQK